MVGPHVLQANASALFTSEALDASITPLVEAANFALDDIGTQGHAGTTVAKRWAIVVLRRGQRTAARRAAMLLGALRGGNAWRKVEVESAAGERVTLYMAPDKNPHTVKTEGSGNKFSAELKVRQPQVGWRLLREEGILSAGYQNVVRIVAESSTLLRLEYNTKALADQGLQKADMQSAWAAVAGAVNVQWSS